MLTPQQPYPWDELAAGSGPAGAERARSVCLQYFRFGSDLVLCEQCKYFIRNTICHSARQEEIRELKRCRGLYTCFGHPVSRPCIKICTSLIDCSVIVE